jgi:hypothetical protein
MSALKKIDPKSNAYTFVFDEKILDDIRSAYHSHILPHLESPEHASLFEDGESRVGEIGANDQSYFYTSYGKEPLIWVANNNWHTYELFKNVFEALDIRDEVKQLVDFENDITLYSGFLVVGNRANIEAWHLDFVEGANAYTLITPLFELDAGHGNLLYKDTRDDTQTYLYKLGEAIIVGDNFSHATEPYAKTEKPRILLSLTFGTDKIVYWDALKQTIVGQSMFLILPCGHQRGSCQCLESTA